MIPYRPSNLIVVALLALTVGCSPPDQTPSHSTRGSIATYLDRLEAFGFSGQVVVAAGQELLVANSYGYANRFESRRLRLDEPMAIASLSKQFTAAAVLCLVDDGVLSLDDSLAEHLPGVPSDKRAITIHQLLTHTSGLPRDAIRREVVHSRDGLIELVLAVELRRPPGTEYGYSNAGYQLLAALVDVLGGQPFDDFCQTRLFRPAGMEQTRFIHDDSATVRAYNEWTDVGTWTDWPTGWKHRGSGGHVSTANDLHAWWNALRFGRIISLPLVRRMLTPRVLVRDDVHYCYGWEIRTPPEGDLLIVHGGDNGGFHSELRFNAATNDLVIVLTNLNLYDESGWWLGLHKRVMAHNLLAFLRGDSPPLPPDVTPIPSDELTRYDGTYALQSGGSLNVWAAGGGLWLGARGQDAVDLFLPADSSTARHRKELNVRTDSILNAVRHDISDLADLLKPGEVRFFAEGMREEWTEWEQEHGPFEELRVSGSVPLPWDSSLVRTQVQLVFGGDTLDYHFTWNGDDLYETISEIGRPYPLIVPVARLDDSALVTFDHVTEHSVEIDFDADPEGHVATLRIGESVARR